MAALLLAVAATAATPNFTEDFTTGGGGFTGGAAVTRVLSGGVGGVADPYLEVSNVAAPLPGNLGSFSPAPDLVGDLSGIGGYSFWLRDTGQDDALEIHVGVGITFLNFWLSVDGFVPPDGSWAEFSVDLGDSSRWVQIIGTGSFEAAKAGSTALLFRHDVPPLVNLPQTVNADFGLDRITVLPGPAGVPSLSRTGALALGLGIALAWLTLRRQRARR